MNHLRVQAYAYLLLPVHHKLKFVEEHEELAEESVQDEKRLQLLHGRQKANNC